MMIDPLNGFDWNSLYGRYDRMCAQTSRFNPEVPTLDCFKSKPKSDRELYYFLLSRISDERKTGSLMLLPSYEAILYWKMYSTSPKTNNDIKNRSDIRLQLQKALPEFHSYPIDLKQQQRNAVSNLVRRTMNLGLYGMGLPVCTTVLHFLYPSIIPIFDQMILRSVGYERDEIKRKRLNQSQELYGDYLEFHWSLVEKYRSKITNFCESSVRIIEMALWISRGKEKGFQIEWAKEGHIAR